MLKCLRRPTQLTDRLHDGGVTPRVGLAIEVDRSLPGLRVTRVLDRLRAAAGLPQSIVLDNGPEFAGCTLEDRTSGSSLPTGARDHSVRARCSRQIIGGHVSPRSSLALASGGRPKKKSN